jgi:hypothetical protein
MAPGVAVSADELADAIREAAARATSTGDAGASAARESTDGLLDGLDPPATGAELATGGECLVLQHAPGADERSSPVLLAWPKRSGGVGPTRELAVRGELQREHFIAGETAR